jgi:antitoxin YefM
MRTLSSTELRKNLAETMDQVNDDHMPVIVTRAGGKPAVLLSLEDYYEMDETAYLMSSPANREALTKAIANIEDGKVITKTMEELEAMESE